MSESVEVEYALTVNVEDAMTELKRVERLIFRILGLIQRMGLPPEIEMAIRKVQQLIMTLRMLQITINMMLASNPVTAAIGIAGLVGTAVQFGSGSILEGY